MSQSINCFKISLFFLLLVFTMGASPAFAVGKIAVVDIERAVMNTKEAKKQVADFEALPEIQGTQKRIELLQEQGNELLEKLRKDESVMTDEEKLQMQRRVALIRTDLEHEGKKLQELEKNLRQSIMQDKTAVVKKVIDEMIVEEGIGLLLRDLQNVPVVLHSDTTFDVTPKITAKLNKAAKATKE